MQGMCALWLRSAVRAPVARSILPHVQTQARFGALVRPVPRALPSAYPHLGALRLMSTQGSDQERNAQLEAQRKHFRIKNQSTVLYFASIVRMLWVDRTKH